MRAVIQCVNEASVTVDNTTLASIGKGALVLLGIGHGDTAETAQKLWNKIYKLRMFDDAEGKTNLSLQYPGRRTYRESIYSLCFL